MCKETRSKHIHLSHFFWEGFPKKEVSPSPPPLSLPLWLFEYFKSDVFFFPTASTIPGVRDNLAILLLNNETGRRCSKFLLVWPYDIQIRLAGQMIVRCSNSSQLGAWGCRASRVRADSAGVLQPLPPPGRLAPTFCHYGSSVWVLHGMLTLIMSSVTVRRGTVVKPKWKKPWTGGLAPEGWLCFSITSVT